MKHACLIAVILSLFTACNDQPPRAEKPDAPFHLVVPMGLVHPSSPPDNALTADKVALGKQLFFDKNLSHDRSMSCATCHDPDAGWSNGQQFAIGVTGVTGKRNVPTLFNVAYNSTQFWDGRAASLEEQALRPILNPDEMALPSLETLVHRVNEKPDYQERFNQVFSDGITSDNVAKAIAAFERTILSGDAPYDRYRAGDQQALSPSAVAGMKVYFRKAVCGGCHGGRTLTDFKFYNLGVGIDHDDPDIGRQEVTSRRRDRGTFKTPTLREIMKTAPYMHDGSLATLDEVIDFYDKGGVRNPQLADSIRPLRLTDQEKQDLLQFLVEAFSQSEPQRTVASEGIGS